MVSIRVLTTYICSSGSSYMEGYEGCIYIPPCHPVRLCLDLTDQYIRTSSIRHFLIYARQWDEYHGQAANKRRMSLPRVHSFSLKYTQNTGPLGHSWCAISVSVATGWPRITVDLICYPYSREAMYNVFFLYRPSLYIASATPHRSR